MGYSDNRRMAVNSLAWAHFATPAAISILEFLPFHSFSVLPSGVDRLYRQPETGS